MEIKPFNQGNIDLVAEMAEGVWGKIKVRTVQQSPVSFVNI